MQRKNWLFYVMERLEYPEDAVSCIVDAYEKIHGSADGDRILENALTVYENDWMHDFEALLRQLKPISAICGLREETVDLVFLLCMAEHLRSLYEVRGLSEELYWNSMLDTRYKLLECWMIRGVWGTFVAAWFGRFFQMTRFAIGRLQFEPSQSGVELQWNGRKIAVGDTVVGIHIPSAGPLDSEACLDSFRRAAEFFAPLYPDGEVPFCTHSWLLSPDHFEILPENSNIRKFMDFFHIFPSDHTVEGDLWRIFGTEKPDLADLSKDTGLQRSYARALESGRMPVMGKGVFWYRNGEIL